MKSGSQDSLVRISIEIDRDLHHRLQSALPWGTRAPVLRTLLRRIVEGIERGGAPVLGGLQSGQFKFEYDPDAHSDIS